MQTIDLVKREDKRMDEPNQSLERARDRVNRSLGILSRGSEVIDVYLEDQTEIEPNIRHRRTQMNDF